MGSSERNPILQLIGISKRLVIGSIANVMDLLALASSVRFMVTGAVLLLAVTLNAYTHAHRQQTGRS